MRSRVPAIFATRACLTGLLVMAVGAPVASAAVTLSVRVVRGGLDLDFGTVEPGRPPQPEELELTITNTGSSRYRVYQELTGFLANERGARLPEGALVMQISRGMTGTPSAGGIVPVSQRAQELFISNASGQSDTLLLAYSLLPKADPPAGSYRGLLRFTVESSDTGTLVTQTINVRLVVPGALRLERLGTTPSRIGWGRLGPGERSSVVELALGLINNTGSPTELMQELVEPLTNGQGDRLPSEALSVATVSEQGAQPWRAVSASPERIVTDDRGELRQVRLSYAAAIPADQRAGVYRGLLRLRLVNPLAAAAEELRLPLEVEVNEVFTVSVKPAEGTSTLNFGRAPSGQGPVERSMVVEITTNMGRPYQVLAGLDHPLVLPSGESLPATALVWSVAGTRSGRPLLGADAPVAVGYEPIYQSDSKGSPETFVIHYRFTTPADAKEGVYSGQLRFTVTIS